MKTLKIDIAKEYKLIIEEPEELKDSFFKGIYEKAAEQVAEVVIWAKSSTEKTTVDNNHDTFKREEINYNNIVAFVGERGTGKTSAMITMAQALVKFKKKDWFDNGSAEKIEGIEYHSLRAIDPTRFEENQNIIEVIIAELFNRFVKHAENSGFNEDQEDKRKVLDAFQKVYKNLKTISDGDVKNKYDGEPLEALSNLSEGTNLQENLSELIQSYLDFVHPNKAKNKSVLIIPVDDFDQNVKNACEMAEQIRKYLMIPQVLILMAIKIDQFVDVKTQDVIKNFQTFLQKQPIEHLCENPKEIATKYTLKLIPMKRRLFLPNVNLEKGDFRLHVKNAKTIIDSDKTEKEKAEDYKDIEPIELDKKANLEQSILKIIYKKTNICFVPYKHGYHYIIPKDLRGVVSFIKMLDSMGNKDKLENLIRFENYFFNYWIKSNIPATFLSFFLTIKDRPYTNVNKYIINSISEILKTHKGYEDHYEKLLENEELKYITDRTNIAENVSYGDLLFFKSQINRSFHDDTIKRVVAAINIFYSISLNLLREIATKDESNKQDAIDNIKGIINGTIFNPNQRELILDDNSKNLIQYKIKNDGDGDGDKEINNWIKKNIYIPQEIDLKEENFRTKLHVKFYDNVDTSIVVDAYINIFTFIYNCYHSEENPQSDTFFSLPFNNIELWEYVINNLEIINISSKQDYFDSIHSLFSKIRYIIDNFNAFNICKPRECMIISKILNKESKIKGEINDALKN